MRRARVFDKKKYTNFLLFMHKFGARAAFFQPGTPLQETTSGPHLGTPLKATVAFRDRARFRAVVAFHDSKMWAVAVVFDTTLWSWLRALEL